MPTVLENFYGALFSEASNLSEFCVDNINWHVSAPVDDLQGVTEINTKFAQPIRKALVNLERKPFIQFSGESDGKPWIAATGVYLGNFESSLYGIPATHRPVYLRFTELVELQGEQIKCGYIILDVIDLMDQAAVNPLRPAKGKSGTILPPTTMDGIDPDEMGSDYSASSKQLVRDMLAELGRFDGKSLLSMKLQNYWHRDFVWYGPAGIGTTRGITGFREQHQGPFVFSFPDRVVDHCATFIARGNYIATGGWPHMHGTHTGGGWLGLPPTDKYLSLRVMDIWRREGALLKENWVAIDIVDICRQMGLDVFAMMKAAFPATETEQTYEI